MAVQQQLIPSGEPRDSARHSAAKHEDEPAPVWLQRMSLVVLVIFCFYIGVLMLALPWWPRYWDHNGWLLAHPLVGSVLERGWARGVVSGIGLLDMWIGVSEVIHYRDYRP